MTTAMHYDIPSQEQYQHEISRLVNGMGVEARAIAEEHEAVKLEVIQYNKVSTELERLLDLDLPEIMVLDLYNDFMEDNSLPTVDCSLNDLIQRTRWKENSLRVRQADCDGRVFAYSSKRGELERLIKLHRGNYKAIVEDYQLFLERERSALEECDERGIVY